MKTVIEELLPIKNPIRENRVSQYHYCSFTISEYFNCFTKRSCTSMWSSNKKRIIKFPALNCIWWRLLFANSNMQEVYTCTTRALVSKIKYELFNFQNGTIFKIDFRMFRFAIFFYLIKLIVKLAKMNSLRLLRCVQFCNKQFLKSKCNFVIPIKYFWNIQQGFR